MLFHWLITSNRLNTYIGRTIPYSLTLNLNLLANILLHCSCISQWILTSMAGGQGNSNVQIDIYCACNILKNVSRGTMSSVESQSNFCHSNNISMCMIIWLECRNSYIKSKHYILSMASACSLCYSLLTSVFTRKTSTSNYFIMLWIFFTKLHSIFSLMAHKIVLNVCLLG